MPEISTEEKLVAAFDNANLLHTVDDHNPLALIARLPSLAQVAGITATNPGLNDIAALFMAPSATQEKLLNERNNFDLFYKTEHGEVSVNIENMINRKISPTLLRMFFYALSFLVRNNPLRMKDTSNLKVQFTYRVSDFQKVCGKQDKSAKEFSRTHSKQLKSLMTMRIGWYATHKGAEDFDLTNVFSRTSQRQGVAQLTFTHEFAKAFLDNSFLIPLPNSWYQIDARRFTYASALYLYLSNLWGMNRHKANAGIVKLGSVCKYLNINLEKSQTLPAHSFKRLSNL